ncbi:MAG: tetratricopeptide repeat protein [Pyrinomonadaceae bacterium]
MAGRMPALPAETSALLLRTARVILCVAVATVTGVGCGWIGTERSVRFNAFFTEREMARLPPLPTRSNGLTEKRLNNWFNFDAEELDTESEYKRAERYAKDADELWQRAHEAEGRGGLKVLRQQLRSYLESTAITRTPWFDPQDRQARRNSAIDQLDALSSLDKGSPDSAVKGYLEARRIYDAGQPPEKVESVINELPPDKNLADNIAYLRAALLYRADKFAEASGAFGGAAERYPRGEKREAALFMSALAMMKTSRIYVSASGDDEHPSEHFDGGNRDSTAPGDNPGHESVERDAAWHAARDRFRRVMREHPRGRYARDARGWLAYLMLRAGDRSGALVEYYRMLGDENDVNARLEGAFSLSLVRHHASAAEMSRVEAEIEDEPATALAYTYHNLYNYAIDPGCTLDWFTSRDEWEERQYETERRNLMSAEKRRVTAFAALMMKRHPRMKVGGSFAVRLAQANLELDENVSARAFAVRAMSSGVSGKQRAEALWVKGVAEHHLKQYDAARLTLHTLIEEDPHGSLTEGARRFLAMAAEDAGDLDAALEQYIALGYEQDVAYFVDVLMTVEQLDEFILRHHLSPLRDALLYSLGVRHLRSGRYAATRTAFAQVRTIDSGDSINSRSFDRCYKYSRIVINCIDPKSPNYEERSGSNVSADWVMRDMKTADDLERLENAVHVARDDEAKAEALYQLASYQYEASELLFYNPALWKGMRFTSLHYDITHRAPNEPQIYRVYMEEHEPVARALKIYLQIAREYPQTRAARDALYTAAVCHERLSNSDFYWPAQYQLGLYPGERLVSYRDVRRAYPSYRLPRGTDGWEPLTRTVNGGPAWDVAPKPPPLTRADQARRRIKRLERHALKGWELIGEISGGRLRRWSLVIFVLLGALFTLRATRRAHRFLYMQLARGTTRQRAEPSSSSYAPTSTYAAHLPYTSGTRFYVASRNVVGALWQLAFDKRGRTALALNVVTHCLLSVLVWALARSLSVN